MNPIFINPFSFFESWHFRNFIISIFRKQEIEPVKWRFEEPSPSKIADNILGHLAVGNKVAVPSQFKSPEVDATVRQMEFQHES